MKSMAAMKSVATISVIMSVYNASRYLAPAIESILAQTYTNFEFLIINDGSTDNSLQILRDYAATDSRIRLISRENRGMARSGNELIQAAGGDFIARMDSDDIALPHRLAEQLDFMHQHPQVVCVGGAYDVIDTQGRYLTCLTMPEDDRLIQLLALKGHTPINHACSFIRRSALLTVKGYDETMTTIGDLDLFLRLGEVGQLANLKTSILRYRVHDKSISATLQQQQIEDKRIACERAWQRRGIQGSFEATEHWRPSESKDSRYQYLLKFGWWAFNSQQRLTALRYGVKAILMVPQDLGGWRLASCALFKSIPPNPSC